MPNGLVLHQGLVEHQEPVVPVELSSNLDPAVNRCQFGRKHEAGQAEFHQATMVAQTAATIAATACAVLIQSIMPAGRDAVGEAVLGGARVVFPLPADLAAVQRHQIDGVAGAMPGVHGPAGAARDQLGLALTRALALPGPGSPGS